MAFFPADWLHWNRSLKKCLQGKNQNFLKTHRLFEKDKEAGQLIEEILAKYPQHKRVLFLKAKYDNNEVLSPADVSELKKFRQHLK